MKRIKFHKVADDLDINQDTAFLLAVPGERDQEVIDAVQKSDGDESVERAAVLASRALGAIVVAYGGKLPDAVIKSIDVALAKDGPGFSTPDTGKPFRDGDAPPWILTAVDNARKTRGDEFKGKSDETILRVLLEENPAWLEDDGDAVKKAAPKPTRTADEILWDAQMLRKSNERGDDMAAESRLAKAAEAVRRREPGLSKAQAFAKATNENPDLYAGIQRQRLRVQGFLNDSPAALTKARDAGPSKLEAAAVEIRKADPTLTEAQSVAKALDLNPDLYTERN